ncbi:MAG TPA: imidazole glycerol phosphate synthase subunit HisH [Actinobacteria bacterium]|nr:imidazole glycerol phosphate synthase subunit HisH [Actinomycetota bacterium]
MIAIVDYGVGNLRSVQKGFERVSFEVIVTTEADVLRRADGIVLPGVGAFRDAVSSLARSGLGEELVRSISKGKLFLGICLGLHLLFSESEEHGITRGLDVIPGRVVNLPSGVKVPHMGWNQVRRKREVPIFEGIPDGSNFYFVHSYYARPEDEGVVATITEYGVEFASSIWCDNLFGVQFHPEKSGEVGLKVLKNFGELCD